MADNKLVLRHRLLQTTIPAIYECAVNGSRRAWLAPYDERRCWGDPVECRLSVVDEGTVTKITFDPLPSWPVPKRKRIRPPLRLGVILGNPQNDPVWFADWIGVAQWVRLNAQPGDTVAVSSFAPSVSTGW